MYNNNFNGGYNPYQNSFYNPYSQFSDALSQQSKNNQTQTVTPTQNVVWIQVNGVDGAKDVAVQPNQTKWLMDINSQSFFVKSSDNMGVSTLKCYRFEEFDPISKENNNLYKEYQYVTKDEFEALKSQEYVTKNEFEKLKSKLDQYEKNINDNKEKKK